MRAARFRCIIVARMCGRIGAILILWATATCAQTNVAGNPGRAENSEQVCLGEILIKTPQPCDPSQLTEARHKTEGLLEQIRKGEKFEDIARKYSEGPSAAQGGDVGGFKRGQLSKAIEDRAFAMKSGDISDVIRTKQGFVILQVSDCAKRAAGHVPSRSVDILSDTHGVNFGPYLDGLTHSIQANWYREIPESAKQKRGTVMIEIRILKAGNLDRIRVAASSGDAALDGAAWGAITESAPFPVLPSEFGGEYLELRLRFLYNLPQDKVTERDRSVPLSW